MIKKNNLKYLFIIILLVLAIISFPVHLAAQNRPKIGLALGVGGARGYVHIGVIKALEREGIKIDYIAGSSVGSLIGSLYALGFSISEIEKVMLEEDFKDYITFENISLKMEQDENNRNFINFALNIKNIFSKPSLPMGLISAIGIRDRLDDITNWAHFEFDLKIPFKAVATDLVTGEMVVLDEGKVSNAVAASISVPGMFAPFQYDGKILVDGGMKNPVPADIARQMGADIVIAVNLWDITEEPDNLMSIFYVAERSIDIMVRDLTERSLVHADIVIQPTYQGKYSFFMDKKERINYIKLGESEVQKKITSIKELINNF